MTDNHQPFRRLCLVTSFIATLLVATATSSLDKPATVIALSSALAAAGTVITLILARYALGSESGLPAISAALLLAILGAVTAEELTGEGKMFAIGIAISVVAFSVVARACTRFHASLPIWTLPAATAAAVALMALTRFPLTADPVLMTDGSFAFVNASVGGYKFQPGEFTRPVIAFVIAAYIARSILALRRGGRATAATVLRISLPIVGATGLFVVNADLGPLLFLMITTLVLVLLVRPHPLVALTAVGTVLIGAVVAYFMVAAVQVRVQQMLNPVESDGSLTNIGLGLRSIARGGIFGMGVGNGTPNDVYFAESDFVFTAIGNIRGAAMFLVVLVLFAVIVRSVWLAAARATGETERLVAMSAALLVTIQVVWTIAANLGALPVTGMTVPFLSAGSSSMIALWCTMAVALSLGRRLPVVRTPNDDYRLGAPRWLSVGAVGVLAALSVQSAVNPRVEPGSTVSADWPLRRGSIVAADGTVLAATGTDASGAPARVYPEGSLFGDLVGFTKRGDGQGLEEAERNRISCQNAAWQRVLGLTCTAPTLVTTFEPELQRIAASALDGKVGDVVVVDARSGAIVAGYSTDPLDPDRAISLDVGAATTYLEARRSGTRTLRGPAFSSYSTSPGSVFKLVTATAALTAGIATDTAVSDAYTAPGGSQAIHNANNTLGGGTLEASLAASANTAFAEIATRVGEDALRSAASQLTTPPTTTGTLLSEPMTLGEGPLSRDALARSGFGQEGVRATPLSIALLGAQITQGEGMMPIPNYVRGWCTGGEFTPSYHPPFESLMWPQVASELKAAMVRAVDEGRVPDLADIPGGAAAKTGTAERPDGAYDGTIVAFAPVLQPRFVVSVRVEGEIGTDRSGADDAGPVAAELLSAALDLPDRSLSRNDCAPPAAAATQWPNE
ncbi:FtsW/RodA/SpoVE family cell cycle protein [Rhodococcus globerulus]|uniref:FtsW/RodA/SpoVE family cell cycle protein n=1 Tax=Rhodococcus globerulus TaxID=33008 RepID=UPI00301AAF25